MMYSFPWDARWVTINPDDGYPEYDNAYSAEQWCQVYATFFSNGVFFGEGHADDLSIVESDGMTIGMNVGGAVIRGTMFTNEDFEPIAIEPSDSLSRIDLVVIRRDANVEVNDIYPLVIKGTPAPVPTAPSLVRNQTLYDLCLAEVHVPANAEAVTQANITDTRLDSTRCGVVTPFYTIDTSGLWAQYQAQLQQSVGTLTARAYDELNRLIEMNERLTGGLNSTCGCEYQIDELKEFMIRIYGAVVDDMPFFTVGKSIYAPKGEAAYDEESETLTLSASSFEFDEETATLTIAQEVA